MFNPQIYYKDYTYPAGTGDGPIVSLDQGSLVGWIWPATQVSTAMTLSSSVLRDGLSRVLTNGATVLSASVVAGKLYTANNNDNFEIITALPRIGFNTTSTESSDIIIRLVMRPRPG